MDLLLVLKALLTRLIFLAHGVGVVYLLYKTRTEQHALPLIVPLAGLLIESLLMLCDSKLTEFRYFWLSAFFYITTVVPVIWIIELEELQIRLDARESLLRMNLTELGKLGKTVVSGGNFRKMSISERISDPSFWMSNEVFGKKVCELGLFIGLIIGRWLIPRGSITREQLSALLLSYVGSVADILEIFELFNEEGMMYETGVTYAVITCFTLSLYQFSFVTTATTNDGGKEKQNGGRKVKGGTKPTKPSIFDMTRKLMVKKVAPEKFSLGSKLTDIEKQKYIDGIRHQRKENKEARRTRGKGKKVNTKTLPKIVKRMMETEAEKQREIVVKRREMHAELFQILVTLFMQDGPFLILRMYAIVMFNTSSEMHMFFTCKNMLVALLLIYRLLILNCSGVDEDIAWSIEDPSMKLSNIQNAMMDFKTDAGGTLKLSNIHNKVMDLKGEKAGDGTFLSSPPNMSKYEHRKIQLTKVWDTKRGAKEAHDCV